MKINHSNPSKLRVRLIIYLHETQLNLTEPLRQFFFFSDLLAQRRANTLRISQHQLLKNVYTAASTAAQTCRYSLLTDINRQRWRAEIAWQRWKTLDMRSVNSAAVWWWLDSILYSAVNHSSCSTESYCTNKTSADMMDTLDDRGLLSPPSALISSKLRIWAFWLCWRLLSCLFGQWDCDQRKLLGLRCRQRGSRWPLRVINKLWEFVLPCRY